MTIKNVTPQDVEQRLAEYLKLVDQGEEIVIVDGDKARAKLVPIPRTIGKTRVFGQHCGAAVMTEDFDAPLPEEYWLGQDTPSE